MERPQARTWLLIVLVVIGTGVATAATANYLTSVSQNDDGTVLNQPGGPAVTMTGNTDVYNASGGLNATAISWNTTDGNATFVSSGDTAATVDVSDFNATWTNVTALSVGSANLTIATVGKPSVTVGGGVGSVSYQSGTGIVVDDGSADFVYSASSSGTFTAHNFPASTSFTAATASGQDLGEYTTDSSGTVTISLASTAGSQSVYLFTPSEPTVTDLNPDNGTGLQTKGVNLTANVSDADFATAQGDNVTVTFEHKGPGDTSFTDVGTDSLTANGTAKTTLSGLDGGAHDFRVRVQDRYSTSVTTSNTNTFNVPSKLFIYNESAPGQQLTNTTATVQVYGTDGGPATTVERTTTSGELNLTGLPADQPLVISADAPNYRPRRIFVPSLYETQKVYLLPDSQQYTEVVFDIKDFSGFYPSGTTVLEVQRAINGSWTTVLGDYFGATGEFSAQLAYNTRHRLVLRNTDTGRSQVLGTYTPLASGSETVTVSPDGSVEPPDRPPGIDVNPASRQLVGRSAVPVSVSITNKTDPLDAWNVSIYYLNTTTGTNDTLFQTSGQSDTGSTVQPTLNLTDRSGGVVKIVAGWQTANDTGLSVVRFTVVEPFGNDNSLLKGLDSMVNLVPAENQSSFTSMLALVITVIGTVGAASTGRMSSEIVGAVALLFIATFGVLGWLAYDVLFVGVVAWGALVFLRRGY